MSTLLVAILAGVLTTLSPCVLPLLPVVLFAALQQHRFGPLALAGGMSLAFTALGIGIATIGFSLDIGSQAVRLTAAIMMIVFGAILLSAPLQAAFARAGSPLSDRLNALTGRFVPSGLGGQFLLGMLLGAVWTPCSGPTLGAAIGLATASETAARAAGIMALFSLGATMPLMALAYGSRQALASRKAGLARAGRFGKPLLGSMLVLVGAMVAFGVDKLIEAQLTALMPDWLVDLTTRF